MSIPKVSIRQIKAARALLAWSQEDLAERSGVSVPTIKRLEALEGPIGGRTDTADKIAAALEAGGVEFTNGGQQGVRMRADRTYGFLYDDKRIVGRIENGELRSDTDGRLVAIVKKGSIHDPETGEFMCELAELGVRGNALPPALKAKFTA